MNVQEEIVREVIEKLRQAGMMSSIGLLKLKRILNGPVENVERDLTALIKKESGIKDE